MTQRRRIISFGIGGFLILFAILYLIPYVWMVGMSFKPDGEVYSTSIFPQEPTLGQYERLIFGMQFRDITLEIPYGSYYKNTIIITVLSLFLVLFTDALAAYAFAKFDFKGKNLLFWIMI